MVPGRSSSEPHTTKRRCPMPKIAACACPITTAIGYLPARRIRSRAMASSTSAIPWSVRKTPTSTMTRRQPAPASSTAVTKHTSTSSACSTSTLSSLLGFREQRAQGCAGVRRAHERFADEEGVHAPRAHARHIGRREDAALRDDDPIPGHAIEQVERGLEPRLEAAQVAVVDAEERCLQFERRAQILRVVHLDEHCHAESICQRLELRHFFLL